MLLASALHATRPGGSCTACASSDSASPTSQLVLLTPHDRACLSVATSDSDLHLFHVTVADGLCGATAPSLWVLKVCPICTRVQGGTYYTHTRIITRSSLEFA
eukprot:4741084-Amphidinium_carterae.1